MAKVKPCDREGAISMLKGMEILSDRNETDIRKGELDFVGVVQAFAAHREAAIAPLVEMLEEAERALQYCVDSPLSGWTMAQAIARATLSKIRGE